MTLKLFERFTAPASSKDEVRTVWCGTGHGPLTVKEYQTPIGNLKQIHAPSFSDYLNPALIVANRYILMKDLKTAGALFEIVPLSIEGRSPESINLLFDRARKIFAGAVPEDTDGQWIMQFFLQDESGLEPLLTRLIDHIQGDLSTTAFTRNWLQNLENHFSQIGQENGLFLDKTVSNAVWRGRMRRTRCCIWRHPGKTATDADIDQVAEKIINAMAQAGILMRWLKPVELYTWLSRWFVPVLDHSDADNMTVEQFLRARTWREDGIGILGEKNNDIARAALHGVAPESDKNGNWYFRGRPTRFITVEAPDGELPIALLTGEQIIGAHARVLWDEMPANSIFAMSMTVQNQETIAEHIREVQFNSVGKSPLAMAKRKLADEVINRMSSGETVHRLALGVFVSGKDLGELNSNCAKTTSLLNSYGLYTTPPDKDPLAQDTFVRSLPFNFDPDHDAKKYIRRSRFWYSGEIAKVAPLFGRSTGTGNPGLIFFNRGADPLTVDPLSTKDRKRNAHALILGPTGSGKTSLIIYMLLQLIAVHKPRIFLVSALPTFKLFADHLKELELTVNCIRIGEDQDISLPPFADAELLDGKEHRHCGKTRDVLTDLELQAVLMITGGDPKEEASLRRSDRTSIRKALCVAAQTCAQAKRQVLTEDVVSALYEVAQDKMLNASAQASLIEKARAMELFCSGIPGQLFNRSGQLWADADVTVFELGALAHESAKDYLSVAITSLLSRINVIAQREQMNNRQIITVIDEAHVLLKNPLITPYLNNMTAMWRTFGSWLWIATQTLKQFPGTAQELLTQPEWWICMTMDHGEVNEIARFKKLTLEEREMLLAAKKEAGKFTEGVILSDSLRALFRNVVPALALALAQTEKHEKALRARIMHENHVSEIEAAYFIADKITQSRSTVQ